jgi:hypothetical protein
MDYVGILIELASDMDNPKKDYALSILGQFAQTLMANRDLQSLSALLDRIPSLEKIPDTPVLAWASNLFWITDLIRNPRTLSDPEADKAAYIMTDGTDPSYRVRREKLKGYDLYEYSRPTLTAKDYLYINPKTSFWKLSKFKKLDGSLLTDL